VLIEPFGFSKTLLIGAGLNVAIAVSAFILSLLSGPFQSKASGASESPLSAVDGHRGLLVLLFATGLATMAMELVWIRIFTPFIGPMVYSFGLILMAYLLATFMGSRIYRNWSHRQTQENRLAWISLTLLTVLPLLAADARVPLPPTSRAEDAAHPKKALLRFQGRVDFAQGIFEIRDSCLPHFKDAEKLTPLSNLSSIECSCHSIRIILQHSATGLRQSNREDESVRKRRSSAQNIQKAFKGE